MSAFVDTTDYDAARTPQLPLRNVFVQHMVDGSVRKALAERGILSTELVAVCGDTAEKATTRLLTYLPAGILPADAVEADLMKLKLAAVWATCSTMVTSKAAAAQRCAEDPGPIPAIPDHERVQMRLAWRKSHPELELNDCNEPHPRFVDRVRRDWQLHGRVAHYMRSPTSASRATWC